MSQVTTEETATTAAQNPYLFKNVLDAACYLVAYFCLPLYSVIEGINRSDGAIFFTALSCCICVVYDCYSRYDKSCPRSKVKKLYAIGIPHFFLAMYALYSIQCYLNQNYEFVLRFSWVYIFLALAPIIGAADLAQMIRDDINARRY